MTALHFSDPVDGCQCAFCSMARVKIAVVAKQQAQTDLEDAVVDARMARVTWAEIGKMLGVSKQTAHERYAMLVVMRRIEATTPPEPTFELTTCVADGDGDCTHFECPQLRDGEPEATGRSCPLYGWADGHGRAGG